MYSNSNYSTCIPSEDRVLFIVSSNYTAVTFLDSNRRIYCIKDRSKNIYILGTQRDIPVPFPRFLLLIAYYSFHELLSFRTCSHKEEKIRFSFYINVMVACVNA